MILFCIIWSLAAAGVYIIWRATVARPERAFIIISAVVLVISLALPLKAPTPPVTMGAKYSLMIMHVIGAFFVVGILVTLGKRRT